MKGGTSKFKTHTETLYKKKKWSSVSENRSQKCPSQCLESKQPQVSVLGKRKRESQTPAQENLESEWSQKAKKKKRRGEPQTPTQEGLESEQPPVSLLGKRRRESQTPAQENTKSEQPRKAKRRKKKKKESQQPTSSLLKNPETFRKAKKTTSAHKKKKNSVLEVDMETGIILVDKENMENLLETSRKDVDIVYVDMSKGQRSAKVHETEELPTAKPQEHGCRELLGDVRSRKKQKHPQKVAPWDVVQGSQPESISLSPAEPLSSEDLEGKSKEAAVFCKKKSKKKVLRNQELEPIPDSLDNSETISERLDSTHHGGVVGAGEECENTKESHSIKKKSPRKRSTSPLLLPHLVAVTQCQTARLRVPWWTPQKAVVL